MSDLHICKDHTDDYDFCPICAIAEKDAVNKMLREVVETQAEQLATLQAKLEQAEKDKSELVLAIKSIHKFQICELMDITEDALAKYEVKKCTHKK